MCLPCDPRCKSCVGRTNYCVSGCESPYLFKDHRCLSDCGTGYTAVSGQCESCDTDCLACSYNSTSESKVCTECGNGKLLHLGTCVQLCPAGYYADPPAGECRACSVECTKCLAAGNKACTACNTAEGYTMIATNVCDFPTCAKGTYFNRTLRSCKGRWRKRDSRVDCRTECAECYGLNNCTACVKGYLLDGKTALCRDECSKLGYKRMPVTFECVGTFRDCGSDRVEIRPEVPRGFSVGKGRSNLHLFGFPALLIIASTLCGDGRNMGEYGCDDGNTKSGDGCSSTCAVEANY